MDELSINSVNNYLTLKQALGNELSRAALSFCRIGYLLKRARDEENILKDSGYDNVNAFASAEFGLDKSQVSRFIRINDKFSIGGYSEHLKSEYEQFGYAKLSLMLLLPDEINEELSPEYTKSDIEVIVNEQKEEKAISDLEVMMEDKEDGPDEFIAAIVKELNDEHPDPLGYFEEAIEIADNLGLEARVPDIKDAYMPDGDKIYMIRIAGQGRFMVSMKDDGINIINSRTEKKTPLNWEDFLEAVREDRINRPSKPAKETAAEKPKKTKKVEPANPKNTEVAPVQQEIVKNESEIVKNEPEIVQEEQKSDNGQQAASGEIEKVEGEEITPEDMVKNEIYQSIRNLEEQIRANNWSRALMYLEDIEFRINRLKRNV